MKFIKKKIEEYKVQKNELMEKAKISEDVAELKAINQQMEKINKQISDFEQELQNTDESAKNPKAFDPLAVAFKMGGQGVDSEDDMPHRKAFMDYVLKSADVSQEYRAKATTNTSDVSVIIPNTIINRVIQKLNATGMIYPRITHTSYNGGVTIPKATAKPTATWVSEGKGSPQQQNPITGSVIFAYHKLQCRVAISLESSITTLALFETTITDNMTEAMVIALEKSIVLGDGNGKPKGFMIEEIPTERIATASADTIGKFAYWVEVESKIPLAYSSTGVYVLAKSTWDRYCVGMTDNMGRLVAITDRGISGTVERRLLGREVILTDYINSFDAVLDGENFGTVVNLKDYILNTNMQMTFGKYTDQDTDDIVNKATLIADGKMVDTESMVLLKKGATTNLPTDPDTKTATPTMSPNAGSFNTAQTVSLNCSADGAEIFYTTDGSSVSKSKTKYTTPIEVTATTTIKAKAYATGLTVSDEMTAIFTITE